MVELTIVKQNGSAYIDSREVAVFIGKAHNDLLRDIRGYINVMEKAGKRSFAPSSFFVKSTYTSVQNKLIPCYLVSKLGCELCASRLTGEKCTLFTTAFITKFNELETAEREAEINSHKRPRLGEFNSAVKNILNGMVQCLTPPKRVMEFLRNTYKPFGIEVAQYDKDTWRDYYTVTEIAKKLEIYSEIGKPHGHAVSAIISKIENAEQNAIAVPYGLVGVSLRYNKRIVKAVWDWIIDNGYPDEIPYQNFNYHIYYCHQLSFFENEI